MGLDYGKLVWLKIPVSGLGGVVKAYHLEKRCNISFELEGDEIGRTF